MRTRAWHLMPFTCLVLACGGDGGGPSSTGTISGSVTSAASGAPLAGATVSVGSRQATSDATGHFDLTGVPTGAATLGCAQPGYVAYSAAITVQEGSNTRDIALATQEVFGYGTFALFVPAGVPQVRAVIVALGGPDTRAFVDGHRAIDEDIPELEAALQAMGEQFRALARDSGFAVIGSGTERWVNDPATDAVILGALQTGAAASDHPELASAPLIMFGISAGGTGAFGIMQRQASRVAGFAMLVPTGLGNFLSTAAQQVPGYVSLAELDDVVDNVPTTQDFLSNRAAGAIWGLAVEPGRGHRELSDDARISLVNWITTVAGLRLPASPGGALRSVEESSGWLGNRATHEIAPFGSFGGDPSQASWLPTAATAADWREVMMP